MHTQTTIALSLLAMGISTIAVIRANRGEQIRDEFGDVDCRTAALAEMLGNRTAARETQGEGAAFGQRPFASNKAIARHGRAFR